MDPTTINSFLYQFILVIDSGFGLIQGDVAYVLNALIVISVTLAGVQWVLAQEAPLGAFFRKNGLYTIVRWNGFFTNPPLIITNEELDFAFDVIDRGLTEVDKALGLA